jgi:hypothetical protein
VKVYIESTSNGRSHEITSSSTGLALVNGALASGTLSKADLWTWINAGNPGAPASSAATAYLIVEYPGDTAFNTVTAFKQIKVTP